MELVAVGALKASDGGVSHQGVGALTRDRLARQQWKAQGADFAFNQPD
jgi:hypothetical protein